jgi:hypothetical protein
MIQGVILQERKDIAANECIEMGDKIKFKVMDVEKVGNRLRNERLEQGLSLIVEVKPIRIVKHKELSDSISYEKDPITGVLYGIPDSLYPDGNIKWQRIPMGEYMILNLERIQDLKWWTVIRMSAKVQGTPFAYEPKWYFFDPDIEAEKQISKQGLIRKAFNIVDAINDKDLAAVTRYLTITMPHAPTARILRSVISQKALDDSEWFLGQMENKKKSVISLFRNAEQLGVIIFLSEKGYHVKRNSGTFYLGISDIEAIQYLESNPDVAQTIRAEIKLRDDITKSILKKVEEKEEEDKTTKAKK